MLQNVCTGATCTKCHQTVSDILKRSRDKSIKRALEKANIGDMTLRQLICFPEGKYGYSLLGLVEASGVCNLCILCLSQA